VHANSTSTALMLVTGGTGTLGRQVVGRLRDAGRAVRVLSRRVPDAADDFEWVRGDLATGDGIDAAVAGAEIIVHLAGTAKGDDVKARHLVAAASRAGVHHLVFISVVGADRIPMAGAIDRAMFGYFGAKRAAELIIGASGTPWTTLRATQFHDLTFTTVQQLAKLPMIPVPSGFQFQPIDSGEVADRLAELALGVPAGLVPDLGGPQPYAMAELVRSYLRASGRRQRPILSLRIPGEAARAVREGANLAPDRAVGRRTWPDFLEARVNAPTTRDPAPA
jgi:uncharacterized protein YbjT (DUF2867 family)